MAQFLKYAMLVVGAFVAMSVPAMAQSETTQPMINLTGSFGAGLVVQMAFVGHLEPGLAAPGLFNSVLTAMALGF